jgi:hypothetical protein
MKLAPKISSIGLARWIYAALLWLYPPRFRREFGTQMRQDFALVYQSERRGRPWWRGLAFWAMIGKDIVGSLWREYRALLPQPRRSWWLRLVAVVSVSVGVYYLIDIARSLSENTAFPDWFVLGWWQLYLPIRTLGVALPFAFGLWTLPVSGGRQRFVRGLSLLFAAAVLVPNAIWFIERHNDIFTTAPIIPIFGAWEPWIVETLLPGIAGLAIVILSAISLRWPSHRWWSIAMLLIYVAPAVTYRIARAMNYIPDLSVGDGSAYWQASRLLSLVDMMAVFGWIFLGLKLWMSVRPRPVQDNVPAAG